MGRPARAPATREATASAWASENASTTLRCPCRSARRPTGPQTTCPSASAPPAGPAADREPLVRATSGTLPNRMAAVGSRPGKDTHGSSGPVRAIT
ncbi:hypothetical protein [Streptomyces monashensis]|uniref:Uncharacterized protein n=1 Tax=Streptomyces monashensis TaxID=1678012 RepID=A0A1S2QKU2_9ACTN|nr:hypothetical protein BIV23_09520 [Streptomyces monashensis]